VGKDTRKNEPHGPQSQTTSNPDTRGATGVTKKTKQKGVNCGVPTPFALKPSPGTKKGQRRG